MITDLFDKNIVKILSFLLISPGSKYKRNEIKDKTKMNNIPLDSTLRKLKSLKIIEEKKKIISLNFNIEKNQDIFKLLSDEYKHFNVPFGVFQILAEFSDKLTKINNINSAILFGSYAKLIYTEKSDIDIAVIFKDKIKDAQKIEKLVKDNAAKISKKRGMDIQLHFFSQIDIKKNKSDPLIKDIIRNGKILF